MAYKNKVYVAFDGDKDIHYYRLMQAWKQSDNTDFNFADAHSLKQARDSSTEESIKSNLQERMRNSKIFVLLLGESTKYLRKFVAWEISQAINRNLPIIVVNLNGKRSQDTERCPSSLTNYLALHISFNAKILQKALEEWPNHNDNLKSQNKSSSYYYEDSTYKDLGL